MTGVSRFRGCDRRGGNGAAVGRGVALAGGRFPSLPFRAAGAVERARHRPTRAVTPTAALSRGKSHRNVFDTRRVRHRGGVLALELRNANALVAGQVATAATLLLLSAAAARPQLAVAYSSVHARSLFSFSAQVSLQNLGHYLNNTLPSFVVSRSLGQASLGFFSRASLLVGLPLTFLAQGVNKTLYPIYPRFRDKPDECRRMLMDVASVTTTAVWPLFAALAGLAPIVVELLLGEE